MFNQKVTRKCMELYFGKFLQSARYSIQSDDGRVAAEMKKNFVYHIDVHLDMHGVVQAAQCECALGMGPRAHCKHIAVLLLALTKQKDGILTNETCTQKLQSFHRTKPYRGSPLKAHQLQLRQSRSFGNLACFDPWMNPDITGKSLPHAFRNSWLLVNCSIEGMFWWNR